MISRSVTEGNFGKFSFFEATAVSPVTSDVQHKLTHSLIEFDLNQLPKSATIKRAILTLYYPQYDYADTIYPVTDTLAASSTEYLAVLQRVVSPWQEIEVTWKTQPETTTKDQVFIPRISCRRVMNFFDDPARWLRAGTGKANGLGGFRIVS